MHNIYKKLNEFEEINKKIKQIIKKLKPPKNNEEIKII